MSWKRLIKWTLVILALAFLTRIFACQTTKVNNHEMATTILAEDRLVISKLLTGSRFPISILGLPGADKAYIDKVLIPYFRFPALRKFRINDVIAFNDPRLGDKPIDRKPLIISRIVALPGDTVIVWDKNLYINREIIEPPKSVRREYRVFTDGSEIPDSFLRKYHVEKPDKINIETADSDARIGVWDVVLDTIAYQELSSLSIIKQIRGQKMNAGDSSMGYWPHSSFYRWNRDQMGPLIVPYKGLTVDIDINSIDQFRDLIENHEKNELLVDFRGVFINGQETSSYTFTKDYYFVLDDNRDNPNDSRIIGYIPDDHILGRVKRILHSPSRNSWFKSVN
jgi:signal peptidase I